MENGIITSTKGLMLPYQKVLAVGEQVINKGILKVGDMVMVSPKNYIKRKWDEASIAGAMQNAKEVTVIEWNFLQINGETCLYLHDNDIEFIIDEADWEDEVHTELPKAKTLDLIDTDKKIKKASKIITEF